MPLYLTINQRTYYNFQEHKNIIIYKTVDHLINFLPKPVFQRLLFLPQFLLVSKQVEMCQHSDDLWKAMDMTDVDELQSFHFIIETRVNQQQNLTTRNLQFKEI